MEQNHGSEDNPIRFKFGKQLQWTLIASSVKYGNGTGPKKLDYQGNFGRRFRSHHWLGGHTHWGCRTNWMIHGRPWWVNMDSR